jgi:hypothetical protein
VSRAELVVSPGSYSPNGFNLPQPFNALAVGVAPVDLEIASMRVPGPEPRAIA